MEDSEARKKRLQALREKANKVASGEAPIKFRNYRPADGSLLGGSTEASENKAQEGGDAVTGGGGGGGGGAPPKGKKAGVAEEEDAIKKELKRHMEEHGGGGGDVLNIAPRKPNWDLKRDVAKKMEKLEKMTQKAIVELLREKIANQEEEESDEDDDEEEEEE